MSESKNTDEEVEITQGLRKWRSLTEPALICNDRVRKVYDATTGRTYPVQWEPIEQVDREAVIGLDNV